MQVCLYPCVCVCVCARACVRLSIHPEYQRDAAHSHRADQRNPPTTASRGGDSTDAESCTDGSESDYVCRKCSRTDLVQQGGRYKEMKRTGSPTSGRGNRVPEYND